VRTYDGVHTYESTKNEHKNVRMTYDEHTKVLRGTYECKYDDLRMYVRRRRLRSTYVCMKYVRTEVRTTYDWVRLTYDDVHTYVRRTYFIRSDVRLTNVRTNLATTYERTTTNVRNTTYIRTTTYVNKTYEHTTYDRRRTKLRTYDLSTYDVRTNVR